ncbi:MAG: beta-phosphoglucomutase [Aggregatilineales bacterium]
MTLDIRALIFDMDGVIANTPDLHYRAWLRLAQEEGVPFTPADNDALRGLSRDDSLAYVFRGHKLDAAAAEALMARKNAYFHQLLVHLTPADRLPGVTALIAEARERGLAVGLASSSQNVGPVLAQLDMAGLFDAVADRLCVVNSKPAPDAFLWAAGRLNVRPSQALVFEDSAAGVQAARAGGFPVVGLGDARLVGAADVVLPSLDGVTLDALLSRLASASPPAALA